MAVAERAVMSSRITFRGPVPQPLFEYLVTAERG